MTNSTIDIDKDTDKKIDNKNNRKKAIKKKKGPLRLEAIIPITLLLLLGGLYGHYLFDSHLKSSLEWTGSRLYGAEINIKKIKTSIGKAIFLLEGLEVTDKEQPSRNLVKIGKIKFQFLWDALLRAKFVIEDAGVFDIELYSPRERPGAIFPKNLSENKVLEKLEREILEQGQEQFDGNALGDIASILGGTDPGSQMNSIKESLKSEQKINQISKDIDIKEKEWNLRLKSLSQTDQLASLQKEIKNIKVDKKKPWVAIKEYKKRIDKVKKIANEYKNVSNLLKKDINGFKSNFSKIDELAKDDLQALRGRFKIPHLNMSDFSMGLFGKIFQSKVAGLKKYTEIAKEYMPPSKKEKMKDGKEKKESFIPKKRGVGRSYRFPVITGYPKIWLKRAVISSKDNGSLFSGNISGELSNLSTEQEITKKPAILLLKGDFNKQKVKGLDVKIEMNHLGQSPLTVMDLKIEQFLVSGVNLGQSESITFGLKKAMGKSEVKAIFKDNLMDIKINNWFSQVDYLIESKNKNVEEILTSVVKEIPLIRLRASAVGTSQKLNWNISSNLGKEISRGVKKQVSGKIKQAELKLQKLVDDRIGGKKRKLEEKYQGLKKKLDKILGRKQKKVLDSKKNLLAGLESKQKSSSAKSKVESQGKKLLKDLSKKIKFPF